MLFIIEAVEVTTTISAASFFGFMGVTMALVLASTIYLSIFRHWCWIWYI